MHQQHLNQYIKFIYIENVLRLVLLAALLRPPKFNLTGGFFIFLLMVTGRGIIFICTAEYVKTIMIGILVIMRLVNI